MTMLERARERFAKDAFATGMGAVIEKVAVGHAVCSLQLSARHRNSENGVMGGVLFTLADFAFAIAANMDQPLTVTLSSQIAFLSPPRGERLIATAECVRSGQTTCYYQVSLSDELGNIVAAVGISGFIKR